VGATKEHEPGPTLISGKEALVRSVWLSLFVVGGFGCVPGPPRYAALPAPQASAVQLRLVKGGNQFCSAGPASQLRVIVQLADGRALTTWAYRVNGTAERDGYLDFSALTWRVSAGNVMANGTYRPPPDQTRVIGRPVTITAGVPGRPDLRSSIEIVPRYDCPAIVELAGADGASGGSGMDGRNGGDGSDGDEPGDGDDGDDGSDGGGGSAGSPGPVVDVALGEVMTERGPVVIARITSDTGVFRYELLDPDGPALLVKALGGAGGAGGSGGRGGKGGDGGSSSDGSKHGSDGSDGSNGSDGYGGAGGAGGRVRIAYDVRHPELRWMVNADTRGGAGGAGSTDGDPGPDGPPAYIVPGDASVLFAAEIAHDVPVEHL
jgi:hypothetical protein